MSVWIKSSQTKRQHFASHPYYSVWRNWANFAEWLSQDVNNAWKWGHEKCLSGPGENVNNCVTLLGFPVTQYSLGRENVLKLENPPWLLSVCIVIDLEPGRWQIFHFPLVTFCLSVCHSVCLLFADFLPLLMLVSFFFVLLGMKPNWGRGNEIYRNDPKL